MGNVGVACLPSRKPSTLNPSGPSKDSDEDAEPNASTEDDTCLGFIVNLKLQNVNSA